MDKHMFICTAVSFYKEICRPEDKFFRLAVYTDVVVAFYNKLHQKIKRISNN